ncbi:hypothetical protein AVDCRST_MAG92-4735 [uncultured Coleofasciculus sp.]|uniref:Uncharacterized protein n=1 Tax=uncultured Coleofasciculus sp. TaxID=1267456 RepID=A0A6J4K5L6_9CYAN|nr:hypothetical protein AVDCRST_MAG92-4735 [uncultured Coleofasciculus sp.]
MLIVSISGRKFFIKVKNEFGSNLGQDNFDTIRKKREKLTSNCLRSILCYPLITNNYCSDSVR